MLSEHVKIARRFQRSIRVDADFGKVDALQGFVCQRSAADGLVGMATQIARTSQRAFTWTGPYGGGKSSLAVALGGLLGPKGAVRTAAMAALGEKTSQRMLSDLHPGKAGWLVVPVVGRKGDPVGDIAAALEAARRREGVRGRPRGDVTSGRELVERLVQEAESRPREGVLLVLDEMGKFLESAAADGGDIYFFQELAEKAARSGGRLVIVGILHQAFEQYASRLGRETRDEWAKIQGRFSDVPLIAGVDEVIDLLGHAIATQKRHPATTDAANAVAASIRGRRPGSASDLGKRLDKCWPLHPVTAAVLGPMSRRRFGQNERSIFGFLSSAEPSGFQEFVRNTSDGSRELFGPDRFWDYLRINLEPAILASNDSHRWAEAVDAVERCEARGTLLHVTLAKSIALIDLFRNGSGLAADRVTIDTCISDASASDIDAALKDLERWSVAVFRKHLGAWASYAGSDFDIDGAVSTAMAGNSELDLPRLAKLAGLQPVLAKRHYHETGTLRWFQTELVQFADMERAAANPSGDAAGRFLLALQSGDESLATMTSACREISAKESKGLTAIGVPNNSRKIRELGRELVALELVRSSRPELDGDNVARREIGARMAAVSADLEEEFRVAFADAEWFAQGDVVSLSADTSLSRMASNLAALRYTQAPCIKSELINRQRPSANTQAGVRGLMHAMISKSSEKHLGIEGFPVEMGLYMTVLSETTLHRDTGDGRYEFGRPRGSTIGKTFRPAWDAADRLFSGDRSAVPLTRLYELWQAPPFGLRRGVLPLLACAFIMANRHRFAVYAEGRFQADISDYIVDIMLQDEGLIAFRRVNVDAFRGAVLEGVAAAIEATTGQKCPTEPLELARQLVRVVSNLPAWSRRTLALSPTTIEVRRVLMHADDPHKALFVDLPAIYGEGDAEAVADGIEKSLRELSSAY
ncbi:MAG: ATP-binding protein, partial [Lacunisphaera sp.]|nr:ATP-binding protein [Lacunisphaera sp.]